MSTIAARLDATRAAIAAVCRDVGRQPSDVTLVAVSKGHGADAVAAAYDAGQRDFGESYVQEFRAKAEALAARPGYEGVRWHFIGHLQRNKMRVAAPLITMAHALDSVAGVRALDAAAAAVGRRMDVLLQVNIGADAQKYGVGEAELDALVAAAAACEALRLRGLMTILPLGAAPRPLFDRMAALRDALVARPGLAACALLSMGMSDDFREAIAAGATHVRVGSAIFGPRAPADAG